MGQRSNILIADDSRMDRLLCRRALEKQYNLIEVANGAEALRILQTKGNEIDLVVSDLMMPTMSGVQLLAAMHDEQNLREIPVVIATSTQDAVLERQCLALGCWDFLHKPYDPVILEIRVQNTLERKQLYKMREQHIKNTFERYVDPTVVDVLLKNEDLSKVDGRSAELSVLFADIRNFTTISELMEPEEVLRLINSCASITSQCVKEFDGVLDKFIGDCTMAYWGAPLPCEDSAYLACCAGHEMVVRTRALMERYSRKYGVEIALGVGINKGVAVVGNVGCEERKDFTVIGDTVNTASRLESNAPRNTIYISRTVAESLGDRAKNSALETKLSLKGKHREIEVLTLDSIELP